MADAYCRICLRSNCTLMGREYMYSIFDIYGSVATDKMFGYVTGLVISREDDLPHHVCRQCFSALQLAFALKLQSEKANKWLLDNMQKQTSSGASENAQHGVSSKTLRTSDGCEASASSATENGAESNEFSDLVDEEEQNIIKDEQPMKCGDDDGSVNTASTSYPVIRVKTIPKEDETGLQECRVCNEKFEASEIRQHMKISCGKGLQAVKLKAVQSRRQCLECHTWCRNTRDLADHTYHSHRLVPRTSQLEADAEQAVAHHKKPIKFKVSQIKMKEESDVAKGNLRRGGLKRKVPNLSDNDASVSDVNTDCEVVLIEENDL